MLISGSALSRWRAGCFLLLLISALTVPTNAQVRSGVRFSFSEGPATPTPDFLLQGQQDNEITPGVKGFFIGGLIGGLLGAFIGYAVDCAGEDPDDFSYTLCGFTVVVLAVAGFFVGGIAGALIGHYGSDRNGGDMMQSASSKTPHGVALLNIVSFSF